MEDEEVEDSKEDSEEGEDINNKDGCSFDNPKVKKACKLADKQEKFSEPCGNDFYTKDISVTYSDSTALGDDGLTWADIKGNAMAPGYEDSSFWVSILPSITFCLGRLGQEGPKSD